MRKLRWSPAAADDLEEISDYLYLHHPSSAASTVQRLYDATRRLKRFPFSGRVGKRSGTRELAFAPLPYMLVYSVDDEVIHILRYLHTSRDRP